MSNNFFENFGNGTIDCYPLLESAKIEKLLIFTEKTLKALKNEFKQFKRQLRPKVKKPATAILRKPRNPKAIPKKAYLEYQPSNISYVYNSNLWRWRRVNEWFNEYERATNEKMIPKNILNLLRD